MKSATLRALALTLFLPLAACHPAGQDDSQPAAASSAQAAAVDVAPASTSWIASKVGVAMEQAKHELAIKNIEVNSVHFGSSHDRNPSQPRAEITPQGQLLIAGKQVPATPAQQAMLLDYRQQMVSLAEAGMDIGTQGADLGIQASKAALWGALSGRSNKQIEGDIKPQTERIEAAAMKLCGRLPALLSSQQQLAAAMPEFRPYATMRQQDIDECGKHASHDGR